MGLAPWRFANFTEAREEADALGIEEGLDSALYMGGLAGQGQESVVWRGRRTGWWWKEDGARGRGLRGVSALYARLQGTKGEAFHLDRNRPLRARVRWRKSNSRELSLSVSCLLDVLSATR